MKKTLILIATLLTTPVMADTVNYNFVGSWYVGGTALGYTGSFSVVDPVLNSTQLGSDQWQGVSNTYSGGLDFNLTFANGATAHADSFDIVVNNATSILTAPPYPLGLSAQMYPTTDIVTAGMTASKICVPGPCGPDDDPLYRRGDSFDTAVKNINGFYMAYYSAPLQAVQGVPNFSTDFGGTGLGIYTNTDTGISTTLTSFAITGSTVVSASALGSGTPVTPVPEPETYAMMLAGLCALVFKRLQNKLD